MDTALKPVWRVALPRVVGVWVVVVGGAGTVSHMGGCVDFTLTFDSSPIKGEGDGGYVVIYVWSWPSHGFVVLSDSVQSMKCVCVHRREYGACWFFVFIQHSTVSTSRPRFRGTWDK